MALTDLTDVKFQSDVFKQAFSATFTDKLSIFNDLLVHAPDDILSAEDKGYFASVPFWNANTGLMTQIATTASPTPGEMTQRQDRMPWLQREIAMAAENLVQSVSGHDPTEEFAVQAGTIVARSVQSSVISYITGIMTTALAATHVLDDSGNVVSESQLIAAKQKLGDAMQLIDIMFANSVVYGNMLKKSILIESGATTETYSSGVVGRVLGMAVVAEDALTLAGGVYSSILAKSRSVLYKFRNRKRPALTSANFANVSLPNGVIADFELSRNAAAGGGTDTLYIRASYGIHVPGMQFSDSVTNPTDAQLATGANWTKVVTDDKLIPIIQYKSAG